MTEKDIIARTYYDTAEVYRRVNSKDPITKQTRQTEALVASGVLGAWSKTSGGDPHNISARAGLARVDGIYFCDPAADIRLGDKVIVRTQAGDMMTLRAGRAMRYISHAEIPLEGDERA